MRPDARHSRLCGHVRAEARAAGLTPTESQVFSKDVRPASEASATATTHPYHPIIQHRAAPRRAEPGVIGGRLPGGARLELGAVER